jgi:alpha-tubulin suppressor-like RCC1 family protein
MRRWLVPVMLSMAGCALLAQLDDHRDEHDASALSDAGADVGSTTDGGLDAGPSAVVMVAAGLNSACAVLADQSVWCWGDNSVGQLGVAPNETNGCPAATVTCATPRRVRIDGLSPGDIKRIVVGGAFACVLDAGAKLWCWGSNQFGVQGHAPGVGDEDCTGVACTPKPHLISSPFSFRTISAGRDFMCGVNFSDSRVRCWGGNTYGQLGNGGLDGGTFLPADPPVVGGTIETSTSLGTPPHTCALVSNTVDLAAVCWGENFAGSLGHAPNDADAGDIASCGPPPARPCNPVPAPAFVDVDGGAFHDLSSIAAGNSATCATRGSNGEVWCWGFGGFGALGTAPPSNVSRPRQVALDASAAALSGSDRHVCMVDRAHALWCWGLADKGQLGNGIVTDAAAPGASSCPQGLCSTTPQRIDTGGRGWQPRLSTGANFTLAISEDGSLWGWGVNRAGQTGHAPGTQGDEPCATDSCTPRPVRVDFPR